MEKFSDITQENATTIIGGVTQWLLVLVAIAYVCSLIQVHFLVTVSSRTFFRIRKIFFHSLMKKDKAWYDGETNCEPTTCVASDVDIIQASIGD